MTLMTLMRMFNQLFFSLLVTTTHYYSPIPGYQPTNPNQAGPGSANQLYPAMNHQPPQQMSHSPSPPNNNINNNNNSTSNNNTINSNNYAHNERAQRQYKRLIHKLETRNTQVHPQMTAVTVTSTTTANNNRNHKNDNLNGSGGARRTLQRTNGTTNPSVGGASSVGTSDDGEESITTARYPAINRQIPIRQVPVRRINYIRR